jgi:hypothetical protein
MLRDPRRDQPQLFGDDDIEVASRIEDERKLEERPAYKTSLTAAEKIRAAAAKLVYGTSDAEIALILGVSNHGRVNEAIKEVLAPLGLSRPGYKTRE